jgi:hypothetical protein
LPPSRADLAPSDRLVTLPDLPKLTLGWEAVHWASKYLRQPNGPNAGQRFEFTASRCVSSCTWYALDESGAWIYRRAVRRLAKGSGKSPFAALMALVELCAPVRLDYWDDAPGGCVGQAGVDAVGGHRGHDGGADREHDADGAGVRPEGLPRRPRVTAWTRA